MRNITVKIENKQMSLPTFITVEEVLKNFSLLLEENTINYENNPIVGAIVNGETMPLGYCLPTSSEIIPIRAFDSSGRRIYRHSICFLLEYATESLFPERTLIIGHALGGGYYFSFSDNKGVTEKECNLLIEKMRATAEASLPIEYITLPTSEAKEHFTNTGYENTVLLLSSRNNSSTNVYKLKDYYHPAYEPLVSNTSILSHWVLQKYEDGLLLRYPLSHSIKEIEPFKDSPQLFSVFKEYKNWGKVLGVRCVGEMNDLNKKGRLEEYVRLSEDLHRRKIANIADMISERNAKAVFIAGPSSSGKTTFAKRVCEQLTLLGYKSYKVSLDDYYLQREFAPKDEDGNLDLEALEALNLKLLDEQIKDLLEGKAVDLPHFSFEKNKTFFLNKPIKMDDKTILVFEGIHALNPRITEHIDRSKYFKIYISALTQLNLDDCNRVSSTDNRILRRIIRDNRTRATGAVETLNMWPSVSRGEKKYIFPHQNNADVMFNSALDYEIGVLSTFARPLLLAIGPENGRAYTEARRLLEFLENVYPIPEKLVPSDSLLREFVGNSDYD
ncbi:MAG: nucleoside kinase [Sphaerochaetaceae bacterium]|nr:nucleoside kinase [Sphaerochaetaceae bacterium]